jgi:hypothetical protein
MPPPDTIGYNFVEYFDTTGVENLHVIIAGSMRRIALRRLVFVTEYLSIREDYRLIQPDLSDCM